MKVISKSDKLLTKSTRSISLSDYGCLRTEGLFFFQLNAHFIQMATKLLR